MWTNGPQTGESSEISDVQSQYLSDVVDISAGRKPCIVNLHSFDLPFDEQRSPAIINSAGVRQQFKLLLDILRDQIRLENTES